MIAEALVVVIDDLRRKRDALRSLANVDAESGRPGRCAFREAEALALDRAVVNLERDRRDIATMSVGSAPCWICGATIALPDLAHPDCLEEVGPGPRPREL